MKVAIRLTTVLIAVLVSLVSPEADAYFFNKDLEAYGYFQLWFTPYEGMPNMQSQVENDYVAGFSLNKVRGGFNGWFFNRKLGFFFQATFVDPVGILDASLIGKPIEQLGFQAGQFKIPSTFENLIDDRKLDFIMRSKISTMLADYSLSRSPYVDSIFYPNNSYLRDLGIAIKAEAPIPYIPMKVFLMVGNGLGANNFIMGEYARGYLITNGFGQFFYGARVEFLPLNGNLIVGGAYNRNYHGDVYINKSKTTATINRESWETDLQAKIPKTGLNIGAIWGQGWLNDWESTTKVGNTKSSYFGWMAQVVWRMSDVLKVVTGSKFYEEHGFDFKFRVDQNWLHNYGAGATNDFYYTPGFNYRFRDNVKLMVEGLFKRAVGERNGKVPDFSTNGVLLFLQGAI